MILVLCVVNSICDGTAPSPTLPACIGNYSEWLSGSIAIASSIMLYLVSAERSLFFECVS
jgi:hypothetical protein